MDPRDYEDPICPFDVSKWQKEKPVEPIPVMRVLEKEDAFLGADDYGSAEKLLLYWRQEAENGNDIRGAFNMENELMGLYRKLGREEEAMAHAREALSLTKSDLITEDSVAAATCFLNAATVYKAFGKAKESVPLYLRAQAIYEEKLKEDHPKLAGLYNNMALALTDVGEFEEAEKRFTEAISILRKHPEEALDIAVTDLNLCDLLMKRDARILDKNGDPCDPESEDAELVVPKETDEKIASYLDDAEQILRNDELAEPGYRAFVFEKCAPGFSYYGRESFAEYLYGESDRIYREEAEKG